MEPGEALSTASQIAVALAGFAGVVVVFRREAIHDWSALDKFRLRLLLANSVLPLGLCMIALLLLTVEPALTSVWRWCSALAVFIYGSYKTHPPTSFFICSPLLGGERSCCNYVTSPCWARSGHSSPGSLFSLSARCFSSRA